MSLLLGLEPLGVLAVLIAALGVVGSVVPGVPGAAVSLAGVLVYWWQTGYVEPSVPALAGFVLLAVAATAADLVGGAAAAKAGGAATSTSVLAGLVGFALFFVAGPLGVLVGVAGTVFAVEYRRGGDGAGSARAALYTTVGMLASVAVQFVVTLAILVGLLLVAVA